MENKEQKTASSKTVVIGSGASIWDVMTQQQLIERIEEMKAEHAYLQDAIGRAETELFYRENPELKRNTTPHPRRRGG